MSHAEFTGLIIGLHNFFFFFIDNIVGICFCSFLVVVFPVKTNLTFDPQIYKLLNVRSSKKKSDNKMKKKKNQHHSSNISIISSIFMNREKRNFRKISSMIAVLSIFLLVSNTNLQSSEDTQYINESLEKIMVFTAADPTAFISRWQTNLTQTGSTESNQIRIPLPQEGGTYNFTVDWGDGQSDNITQWNQPETIHTYAYEGIFTVNITGIIVGWSFSDAWNDDELKLIEISQWGCLNLGNYDFYFSGCQNLVLTATDALNLTGTTSLQGLFSSCHSLGSTGNLNSWNVSSVTNMRYMFWEAHDFNQDISTWNVSSVTDMEQMFSGAYRFNQSLADWNVSSVTTMDNMFFNAYDFNQNVSNWDVSSVTNMYYMFCQAHDFNQDIGNWNVSSVTNMASMLQSTYNFNQNISNWDVSSVTNMGEMFFQVSAFNQSLADWNVSSVTNMARMFQGAYDFNQNISNWDVSKVIYMNNMFEWALDFNQPLNNWNVSSVTNMANMFEETDYFNQPLNNWNVSSVTNMANMFNYAYVFNQNISNWNVSSVTTMASMFENAWDFNQTLSTWNVSSVTNMAGMFLAAYDFNQNISIWDVSSVTNMAGMFWAADDFNQNIGDWNVSSVTNMASMFAGASVFNQPIGDWNVSSVTDMSSMFVLAENFNQSLNNWNVSSVTDMSYMFDYANNFNQPLDNWNVSSVTYMNYMFFYANTFNQSLDNWNVSSVTDMSCMFYFANTFNQPLDNWDVSSVTDMSFMFDYATSFNQAIGDWNVSQVTDMSSMFYNVYNFNQNISNWNVSSVTDMSFMFYNAYNFNQNISTWNISSVTNMESMFSNVSIDTDYYDSLLLEWSNLPVQLGVNFDGGNSQYSTQALSARHKMSNDYNWVITDGGLNVTTWIENPVVLIIDYGDLFSYDVNASDLQEIDDFWLNDTTYFTIGSTGIITNITKLDVGEYWLSVSVNDTLNNILTQNMSITVIDAIKPTWIETPTNQIIDYGIPFIYNVNATDLVAIDEYWLNSTADFTIDNNGVIINASTLILGNYWLNISVNDTSNNILSVIIQITVLDLSAPTWIETPINQITDYGLSFHYDVNASDLVAISQYWLNDTSIFTIDNNGVISNITTIPLGIYWLNVSVNDTSNNILSVIIQITVLDLSAPTWIEIPTETIADIGKSFTYDLNATDNVAIDEYWLNSTADFTIDNNGVIINASTLIIGIYWLNISVNDTSNNILSVTFRIIVSDLSPPSWIETPTNQIIDYGIPFSYDVNATDPLGIDRYFLNDTSNFAIDNNGVITNITTIPLGIYWLNISAEDPSNYVLSRVIQINVTDLSAPTWIETPTNQIIDYGIPFSYDLNATDNVGISQYNLNDTSIFTIDNNGVISNITAIPLGIYWLNISVNDTSNNVLSHVIQINITDLSAPTWIEAPTNQIIDYGIPFSYDLNATDNVGISQYNLNDTSIFTIDNNGIISNITTIPLGIYWLNVSVNDTSNYVLSLVIQINITDLSAPTWIETPTNQIIDYGTLFSYDLNATDNVGISQYNLNDTSNFAIDSNGIVTNTSTLDYGIYILSISVNDTSNNVLVYVLQVIVYDDVFPFWIETPQNISLAFGLNLIYDLNASDNVAIDNYFVNNSLIFQISQTGVLSNITFLDVGIYFLNISVRDTTGNVNSTLINITVYDSISPEWVLEPENQIIEYGTSLDYNIRAIDNHILDYYHINDTVNFQIGETGRITNISTLNPGNYYLEIKAVDVSGNEITAEIMITVSDPEIPPDDKKSNNSLTNDILGGVMMVGIVFIIFLIAKKAK